MDLSSGSGALADGGSYVEGTRNAGGIDGRLLLPAIVLGPGESLILSVLMFSEADARAPKSTPEPDWPFARTDATNTAQLFANIEPHSGLSINIPLPPGESLAWLESGDNIPPVPVPAAVWLFASALLGIAGVTRIRRGASASA